MVFGFGSSSSRLSRWEAAISRVTLFGAAQIGAWIVGVCIVLMGLVTFLTVVLRRSPLAGGWMIGGIEIVQILMAMVSVFALAFTWYLGGHIRIGLIRERVRSPRKRGLLDGAATFLGMLWIAAATWGLWGVSMNNLYLGSATTMQGIREAPFLLAFFIAMGHFAFVLLRSFLGLTAKGSGRPVNHDGLY
ncbi:TRAP transporter small permease [Chloroflexota bacterium]